MKTRTIQQSVTIKTSPQKVYEALMSSRLHSAFTGDVARMSKKIGGTFSVFSGYARGKNLELVKDEKIVQTWRADEKRWPKDHMSIATFLLEPAGKHTRLVFTHEDVPAEYADSIADGWEKYYWEPIKQLLEHTKDGKNS